MSGQKIREHREALKASSKGRQGSQSWLAQQIGAHFTSVSDWERGINQPSPRHLRAIADALGIRIEELYGDADDAESRGMTDAPMHREVMEALSYALDVALGKRQVRA